MDNQEAFNKMMEGLASQDWERSMGTIRGEHQCAYRGDGGKRCAFGWLIPDERYQESFEGEIANTVRHSIPELTSVSAVLLNNAQVIHYCSLSSPEEKRQKYRQLAKLLRLDIPDVLKE